MDCIKSSVQTSYLVSIEDSLLMIQLQFWKTSEYTFRETLKFWFQPITFHFLNLLLSGRKQNKHVVPRLSWHRLYKDVCRKEEVRLKMWSSWINIIAERDGIAILLVRRKRVSHTRTSHWDVSERVAVDMHDLNYMILVPMTQWNQQTRVKKTSVQRVSHTRTAHCSLTGRDPVKYTH